MNIGDKSFEWVFENKKEFVNFTIKTMCNATGLFAEWQEYCLKYYKLEHGSPRASCDRTP